MNIKSVAVSIGLALTLVGAPASQAGEAEDRIAQRLTEALVEVTGVTTVMIALWQ